MNTQTIFVHVYFFFFVGNSLFAFAQTVADLDACARIITRMCGPISAANKYVQVNVRLSDGSTVESLDRGWLLAEEENYKTILNDRLLVRSYHTSHKNAGGLSFEIVPREDEPLSKAEHSQALEMRHQGVNRMLKANKLLAEDLLRYPLFAAEMSRFVHILIRSITNPAAIDSLILHAKDIDFEQASIFRINGCDCITENTTWLENGKCCLSNCYLTQAFTKTSDSKNVSIDECIEFLGKLIRLIEDDSIHCNRSDEIKNAERSLFVWKMEKDAVENRLSFFPTPHDIVLNFLMSSGNIPLGDRSVNFETSHYAERKQIWSEEANIEACVMLSNCDLPTRYVVADRGEGLFVLPVGRILRLCGPRELFGPGGINRTDE
jgi:hypothetical protein